MFRRVFGREIEELFDDFNPIPIASGAIAQVYRYAPLQCNAATLTGGLQQGAVAIRQSRFG